MFAGLICLQLCLGAATWVAKYAWPWVFGGYGWAARYTIEADSFVQIHVVTAHVAMGALVLATSVILAIKTSAVVFRGSISTGISTGISIGAERPAHEFEDSGVKLELQT